MLRDVFYYGAKPNAHPREKFAKNLDDARSQATTEHFWIINEYCDYTNFEWDFDFDFLPDEDVWAENHINVWPSRYQKDSGTWLVANNDSELIIYRSDVQPLKRKNVKTSNWHLLDKVDENKFDFGWHPDPTDPPYIYRWGNKYYPVELMGAIEYRVENATEVKYMKAVAELLPDYDRWEIPEYVDTNSFDLSWRPDPREPSLIYDFGTQWHKAGGPRYVCEHAIEVKYIDGMNAKATLRKDINWKTVSNVDILDFDYSWYPDPTEQPYIYVFGNQHHSAEKMPTIEYHVPGATEIKYINDLKATLAADMRNWQVPDNIDTSKFDFSWVPDPYDPPMIYQFGTQHQKTGGPRYVVSGAEEVKYIDTQIAIAKADPSKFAIAKDIKIKDFDFSWHPDVTEEPYIYVFGNNFYPAEEFATVEYRVEGATSVKYITDIKATLAVNKERWIVPDKIDDSEFDYSWVPNPKDPPYIYVAGTQHQKTGGPRYVVDGATELKYIDAKVKKLEHNNHKFNRICEHPVEYFDMSWHPDETDPPYIYVFGNNQYDAEIMPTIEYRVDGATEIKYINTVKAKLGLNHSNWEIPPCIIDTDFDYSWVPNPKDPPYIYVAGTQWQKTGGPRYVVEGATEIKYIDQKVIKIPEPNKFKQIADVSIEYFDYSWHPDDTDPPYIYHFGNSQYDAETMPTMEYRVEGATDIKYINDNKVKLAQQPDKWLKPDNVDDTGFDYSWIPNPNDPPYMYIAGTQHQKTGGPRYVVDGAIGVKYIEQKVKRLPNMSKFEVIGDALIKDFDYSWHPDDNDPPYIYVFGNNQYDAETMPTLQYKTHDATFIKYINEVKATLASNKKNWIIPSNIDDTGFDYSWVPNPTAPPYIYQFGTQWQKTGGPRYVVEDATEVKYESFQKVKKLPSLIGVDLWPNKTNWIIPENIDTSSFDFSWHPDDTEDDYMYEFGTQHQISGGPIYKVETASETKYIGVLRAKAMPSKNNWIIPENIDVSEFDFSWHPPKDDKPYIYQFGTQHQKTGGPRYVVEGAEEVKYVHAFKAKKLPEPDKFTTLIDAPIEDFDYSWHPDESAPPYIYVFGNQHFSGEIMPTIEYRIEGATQIKYIDKHKATLGQNKSRWVVPTNIDDNGFDYSWVPNPHDPPYIYVAGTQWQKTGGPIYIVDGADTNKYIDKKVISLPDKSKFEPIGNVNVIDFDYSWHPDDTDPAYVYIFGNNQYDAETMPTLKYTVDGALFTKYIFDAVAKLGPCMDNWQVPSNVDVSEFDFSWVPNPNDPPYIYQFGTQHQKIGGPRYVVDNATEIKYVSDQIAKSTIDMSRWVIPENIDISDFDLSWHPEDLDHPYIYVFGTQWQKTGGPKYVVEGANEFKYVDTMKAKAKVSGQHWDIPDGIDLDGFDFTWHPDESEPPYVYQFGTQWQKTGGPTYTVPGALYIKYVNDQVARRLPSKANWYVPENIDPLSIDYTWHPDNTEEPYIYQFGTQWNDRGGPEYRVPGATKYKYSDVIVGKTLPDKAHWYSMFPIDESKFDFTWVPHPMDPPYIYVFGNQWNVAEIEPTMAYKTPGASELKYVHVQKATVLPDKTNWEILHPIDEDKFDFSWRPNPKDPPYIYAFGNNRYSAEKMPTVLYKVPEATEYKYVNDFTAVLVANKKNYHILHPIDEDAFDFSWVPDPGDPAYIYVFGNQYYPGEIMPTVEYRVEGAMYTKYIDDVKATLLPDKSKWTVPNNIDDTGFDYSWVPNPHDPPFIYVAGTQWQKTGGPMYIVEGATDYKYIDQKVTRLPDKSKFEIVEGVVVEDFDYSWHPDDTEPAYVYTFGNNFYEPEVMPTVRYWVEGAMYVKHVHEVKAKLGQNKKAWTVPDNIDDSEFDYSWVPNPNDPPYIYVAGTQWQKTGGPMYAVEFATTHKYIDQKVKKLPDRSKFEIVEGIQVESFDYSWHPDDTEPAYVYVFGNNQYNAEAMPTVRYYVEGALFVKYVNDPVAKLASTFDRWIIPDNIDISSFDFSWVPDPHSPPYIYEFATIWNDRGGPKYVVPGATEYKYITDVQAKTKFSKKNWIIPSHINVDDFDFTWVPHPEAPPYIYQFGTLADDNDGPRYVTPKSTGEVVRLQRVVRKEEYKEEIEQESEETNDAMFGDDVGIYRIETTLEDLINDHPNEIFWAIRDTIDYSKFDFEWKPSIEQARYVHVFGSPDSELTQTYFVSAPMYRQGYTDFNFVEGDKKLDEEYLATLFKPSDMFFVDRGNAEAKDRFEKLKEKFPTIQKTRFLNSWTDTISRCINRSNTELCWILNSELDYSEFNFNYYPNEWQLKMVHVFGTQWSHWGTTYMVNRDTFANDTKYVKIIEHLSNLNFVKDRRAIATNNLYDIVLIDHGNTEIENVRSLLENKACGKKITTIKYDKSYLNTFKSFIKNLPEKKDNYIWVCSSICDYSNFDFTHITDPFARDNLHVFASDQQKFGDTFLVDVNTMKSVIDTMDKLQSYPKVSYITHLKSHRLPAPVIEVGNDTHVKSLDVDFNFPYMIFATEDVKVKDDEHINLWEEDTKNIIVTTTGASRIIVPREAKDIVKKELYDYPYIKTANKLGKSKPLDIVFLSNGELCADENYEHLLAVTKGLSNRVVRVDGVDGRVQGYHAALEASETPWAFTVFAKLKVNNKFDWGWQPDRLQIPKHYIFTAKNPVNGLVYGHQAMIAYNKKLTLTNTGKGLDFTLDDPHESIDLLSGVATFNTDPYSTWRTAFREVIKLKSDYSEIAEERLNAWLQLGEGDFAENCLQGANDAVEYYDSVMGDIEELKKSYEWAWLKSYYAKKYK